MLTVGQKLWYVPMRGSAREVTVSGVGRKWAHLEEICMSIDMKTLKVDGGGFCYLSKKDYEEQVKIMREWKYFHIKLSYTYEPPKGITIERIKQAREILGI